MKPVAAGMALLMCMIFQGAARADDGGRHRRITTARGPVHVWQPSATLSAQSGIVVYVHGLYIDADDAWREHDLGEQFERSGRDAIFIVPDLITGIVGRSVPE